ncbi:MAG TPA: peptide deformylase [Pseudomonadales bacterium]|jgi:peptide deformylase
MALLEILEFPDPRLRKKAAPIATVDDGIRALADNMLETMYAAPGIGLAATQVNVQKQLVVIDLSDEKNAPLVLINPKYAVIDPEPREYQEGCLSVPGYYETVCRPQRIRVTALDREGRTLDFEADGLLAVCIQHECDHLDGKLFVDYLSALKRQRIRQKLEKAHRTHA